MLKRLLPWVLLLPALLGFVCVSYQGCNQITYEQIVQSRGYLVAKNQEQISSVLFYILVAVVFWNVIVILILKYAQNGRNESQLPLLRVDFKQVLRPPFEPARVTGQGFRSIPFVRLPR